VAESKGTTWHCRRPSQGKDEATEQLQQAEARR
jgi:hypothetical protein